MPGLENRDKTRFSFWLWLISIVGVIVPKRLRRDWRQEWEAELRHREALLANWDNLNVTTRVDLLWRSTGAFLDALWLQRLRLEDEMFQDLRYGVRMLTRNPGFSGVVILTLALGIGANAALFSIVNGVLLNPLPYPDPNQLMTLHQSKPNFETGAIPFPNFLDMQRENRTFSAMAISRGTSFSLIGTGDPERVNGRWITSDFFTVLGVKPSLGRSLAPRDDEPGAAPIALISHELWQRKFGASQDVIDKSITLDDRDYTIVGVMPSSFKLLRGTDVFVPMGQWNNPALKSRSAALGLHGIGRLKPGVTLEQADQDLNRIMSDLAVAYPATNKGNGAKIVPLKERLVGDIAPTLLMLFGAVGFVLLIACVNVSNLLIARSTGRTREFAIRAALGAGRWRLVRQSLTESLLLAFAGGGLGLAIAEWGTGAALSALPTALPRAEEVHLDGRVLIFTVAVAALTGILSGLTPAVKTSHWRLQQTLKEGSRGSSGGRVRAQGVFVAVEMAMALVLLIGAALMIRSLNALWHVDPGFRADNALTFQLNLAPTTQTANPKIVRNVLRELSDTLNSTPGIRAVSFLGGASPLQSEDDLYFWIDGQPKPSSQSEMHMSLVYVVEPNYLTAMGIPLRQGRFFADRDDERSPSVAVIDDAFAKSYFGSEDPIGKRINLGNDQDPFQIIGVVGHVKQWGLDSDDKAELQAQLYLSLRALPDSSIAGSSSIGVVARIDGGHREQLPSIMGSVKDVVHRQSPQNIVSRTQMMDDVVSGSLAEKRFSMILLGAFAGVALLLASIGIYGVISYLVGQRTQELGIRLALGASRRDILALVLSHGMKMAISGVVIGLFAALGLTRLMSQMLYGVSTTDAPTFLAIALLLTTVAFLACYFPARRATRVDPLTALRLE